MAGLRATFGCCSMLQLPGGRAGGRLPTVIYMLLLSLLLPLLYFPELLQFFVGL
jgi:hypothetical protein